MLVWVPDHCGLAGNERADGMARRGGGRGEATGCGIGWKYDVGTYLEKPGRTR